MKFEWDDDKEATNLAKHGVSFEEAQTVFGDPLFMEFYDPNHSYGEHRFIVIGESREGRLLMVAYVEGRDATRLISARAVTPKERRFYEEHP